MPFKSQKQRAFLYANKPTVAKKFQEHSQEKFKGKGTRARLNTAAEKKMFNSQYST